MAKISTYTIDATPQLDDKVIGTDVNDSNMTKNYTIESIVATLSTATITLDAYASDAAAGIGGSCGRSALANYGRSFVRSSRNCNGETIKPHYRKA